MTRRNENSRRRESHGRLRDDVERSEGTQPIPVQTVVLFSKDNALKHNTQLYELLDGRDPPLIIRRGQPFFFAIRFKKNFNPNLDSVHVHLEFGPPPHLIPKGNLVILPITNQKEFTREKAMWDMRIEQQEGTIIYLHVQVPATAPVGVWKMKLNSYVPGDMSIKPTVFEIPQNVYILFNPWSKDDTVFLDKEDARKEYVLNDVGKIFVGTANQPLGRRWVYGQYRDSVLPAAMLILENSDLAHRSRGNAVLVSRAISKLVNSEDEDDGILVGRWSGEYDEGTAPWMWTGSAAILDEYFKNGGEESVKYGQCWVFAGVVTTVCRALGIPCRTVTNFVSAHDKDFTYTIDKFIEDGEFIKDGDSIWNFHVWNDAWMSRPDLPLGYGGWQAIDSTPQEKSEGSYQCGPASVVAIKRGQVGFDFDGVFVFAEVNADVIVWIEDETAEIGYRKVGSKTNSVGRFLLTKKIGVDDDTGLNDAEDVMPEYKDREGTHAERMAIRYASGYGMLNPMMRTAFHDVPLPENEDVTFNLVDIDQVMIGQPFSITVKMTNKNQSQKRTVKAILSVSSVYYTGILAHKIIVARNQITLKPNKSDVLSITLSAQQYQDKLVDYSMMKIFCIATVDETKQTWAGEDDFSMQKPKLELECPDTLQELKEFTLTIRFTNPLNHPLTDCLCSIEGPGLGRTNKYRIRDVAPREKFVQRLVLFPQRPQKGVLVANFSSKQLTEVLGSKHVEVKSSEG